MGCEVAVFSGGDSKKDEAMGLGAKEFYAMKNIKDLKSIFSGLIDHLLVNTSAQPDWSQYLPSWPHPHHLPALRQRRRPKSPLHAVLLSGLKIQGSLVAARQIHREMLEFAAYHDIKPITQTFPLSQEGVEKAFQTLDDGKMRYRGVLVA